MKKKLYLSLAIAFSCVILLAVICMISLGRQKSKDESAGGETFTTQDDSANDRSTDEEKQTTQTSDRMNNVTTGDSKTAWDADEQQSEEELSKKEQSVEDSKGVCKDQEQQEKQEKQETQEAIKEQENEDHAKPQPNTETGWGPIS